MAEFTDRIKLVFDAVTNDATKGVGSLKDSVSEAEGGFGKLKAGAGGALDLIKQNAGLSAAAAGTAIAGFIASAVSGFQEAALEANNFGDAVGLSVEDASRWIEVAGDLGVNVEQLQGAVNKLNIATANGVLDKLGIGGETTNDRLLNALQYLQAIPNAADRSKTGMELFGKSWTSLSPLVETAGDLKQALADVSGGQLKTEEDVEAAKRLRDAMDELSDVWERFVQTVGGSAIGAVSGFAEGIANLADAAERLKDATGGIADFGSAFSLLNPLTQVNNLADGFSRMTDFSAGWQEQAKGLGSMLTSNIPVIGGWADSIFGADDSQKEAEQSAKDLAESQKAAAAAAEEQAKQEAEAEKALRSLNDAALASINSVLGLEDAADRTTEAVVKYTQKNDAAAESSYGSATANDEARRAMNDAEQAALSQAVAAAKLDAEQKTAAGGAQTLAEKNAVMADTLQAIANTLAPGNPLRQHLEDYAAEILGLNTTATTTVELVGEEEALRKLRELYGWIQSVGAGADIPIGFAGTHAVTSPSSPSSSAGVSGLAAAPSSVALASSVAAPRSMGGASIVNNISVTVAPFTNPAEVGRQLADYLDAFYRRSGTRARAVA